MDTRKLPAEVTETMSAFLTAELTTVSGRGVPQTWPVLPSIEWHSGRISIMTSIGLPQKAINIRRRPDVCLLFSDPTGSGLSDPPSVLVEGVAAVSEGVLTSLSDLEDPHLRSALERDAVQLLQRQPAVGIYARNGVTRALMGWYFLRLLITVAPRRISWGWGSPRTWTVLDVA